MRDDLVRTLELPANRQEVMGALNKIITWVYKTTNRPLLLITDGLDKVSASRARLLFADSSILRDPACALIYAAPIEFYHRVIAWKAANLFNDYKLLPNPAVQKRPLTGEHWRREREPDEEGVEVMRKVVEKRLSAQGCAVNEIIDPDALGLLAVKSGGVMRELIRNFNTAASFAQLQDKTKIDLGIARKVIDEQRVELQPRLTVQHREILQRVLQQGALSGGQHEAMEDELLHNLNLLSYQSDKDYWFDVYPSLLELL